MLENPPPDSDDVTDECYVPAMLWGDYLTVSQARVAQIIRSNSE